MKKYIGVWHLAVVALLFAFNVQAQTITVGDASGVPGGQATVQLNWDDNGTDYRSLQFDVNFDLGVLPTVDTSTCPIEPYITGYLVTTCEQRAAPDDNQVRLGLLLTAGGIPTGNLGQLTFNIDGGASAGTTDLTITGVVIENDPVPTLINGQITIQGPAYTSNPAPGPLAVGPVVQNDTNPVASVDITNTGATGTTLSGTCSETADPDGVFTVGGTTNFSVLAGDPADTVTVTCDSSGSIDTHTGTMECTHNGDNIASPAVYSLSCTITAGPQPAYSSNPAPGAVIDLGPTEQADPDPSAMISITNTGDTGTTLTGTCGVTGDPQISIVDGVFSVVEGGAADIETVSCDASAQGMFSATVSCDHNGSNTPNPATYTVNCEITPPGQAIFASTPAPGAIDMTPGDDPPAGSANPTSPLTFFNNADPGDTDLSLSCTLAGSPEITVAPDISGGIVIAPDASSGVTFTCNATNVGNYAATYTCPYDTDGVAGDDGSAQYDVTCDIRDAEADVDPNPAGGTTLTGLADPGGTAEFNVTFTEVNDEGIDGEVSCSLADGTNFAITSPTFPATIPAGGSVVVTVTGTAPDDGSTNVSDTLNCTYSDSANPEGTDVSYPLSLEIGGGTIIEVTKAFTEGYDGEVTVTLTCDTGLPLIQQFDISPGHPVFFVVTEFESGAMDCSVTEGTGSGFEPTYVASGDSASVDDDPDEPGCHFLSVAGGDRNLCEVTNAPAPVDVVIEKEWVIAGAVGEEVDDFFVLTLYCDGEIVGGSQVFNGVANNGQVQQGIIFLGDWFQSFNGFGNSTFTASVVPEFPTTNCWVEESIAASAVEVDNGCTNIEVSLNQGDSCLITNTVFFEGIPTLNQWGLAIMALLMLGVGLVGFRRFI